MNRSYYPSNRGVPTHQQLHAFADASDLASCYVVYLRTVTSDGGIFVAFVCGSTRVLPKGTVFRGQLSIPRAEMTAAHDLANRMLDIESEIDIPDLEPTKYYTDSRDVLAWIQNTTEQQKRWVANRREFICKVSSPSSWNYVPTEINPADIGTRPVTVEDLEKSRWTTGPEFLYLQNPVVPKRRKLSRYRRRYSQHR